MAESEPTDYLVKDWLKAVQMMERAKSDLNGAECRRLNAENALGKRLAPSDMKPTEEIGMWVRLNSEEERLIVVHCKDAQTFKLRFRE